MFSSNIPAPQMPTPPANPPMFGSNASKGQAKPSNPGAAFGASMLGSLPTNTAQKTLLGS